MKVKAVNIKLKPLMYQTVLLYFSNNRLRQDIFDKMLSIMPDIMGLDYIFVILSNDSIEVVSWLRVCVQNRRKKKTTEQLCAKNILTNLKLARTAFEKIFFCMIRQISCNFYQIGVQGQLFLAQTAEQLRVSDKVLITESLNQYTSASEGA